MIGAGGGGDATIEPVEGMFEALACFVVVICEHEDEGGGYLFPSANATIAFEAMPVAFIDAELFEEGAGEVAGAVVGEGGEGWVLEFGLPHRGSIVGLGDRGWG